MSRIYKYYKKYVIDPINRFPKFHDRVTRFDRRRGICKEYFHVLNDYNEEKNGDVRFIQIGANDGLRNDPVREFIVNYNWKGTLVEPLPAIFKELLKNYRYINNGQLNFVQAIISSEKEEAFFWTFCPEFLKEKEYEERYSLMRKSSLHQNHLKKFIPEQTDPEFALKKLLIPSITLKSLVEKYYKFDDLDLLVIDVEGAEMQILSQLDTLEKLPESIFFEVEHLEKEEQEMKRLLKKLGYELTDVVGNCFARLT